MDCLFNQNNNQMARKAKIITKAILPIGIADTLKGKIEDAIAYNRSIELIVGIYNIYNKKRISISVELDIPSNYIYKITTRKYSYVLKDIVSAGILLRFGPYHKTRCYRYKFSNEYIKSGIEFIYFKKQCNATYDDKRKFVYVERMLRSLTLKGDKSTIELVDVRKENITKSIKSKCKNIELQQELIERQIYNETLQIDQIIEGKSRYSRNKTNYRLDTNITNLPSIYLNYLYFKNESIVSIDLVNSQFTLLANIILGCLNKIEIEDQLSNITVNFCKILEDNRKKIIEGNSIKENYKVEEVDNKKDKEGDKRGIIYRGIMYSHSTKISDLMSFCETSISGTLYDTMVEHMDIKKRNEAKKACFQVLFGTEGLYSTKSKNQEIFNSLYPTVTDLIINYKQSENNNERQLFLADPDTYRSQHRGKAYSQVGSAQFVNMLAKFESAIFIDLILPVLKDNKLFVLTKHDSILVPQSQYKKAHKILVDELKKYLPYGFRLRTEVNREVIDEFQYSDNTISVINNEINTRKNDQLIVLSESIDSAFYSTEILDIEQRRFSA